MFENDNQRCLVYKFESDLCDAGYVQVHAAYTSELRNSKAQVHPSASTFVLNILQHLKILRKTLAF